MDQLTLDDFGMNIFLIDEHTGLEACVSFYEFLTKRPAIAMLATILHDFLHNWQKIFYQNFAVIAHDFKAYKGLALIPAPDITPEEKEAYDQFIELLEEQVVESAGGIEFDAEAGLLKGRTERELLTFLRTLAEDLEWSTNSETLNDPAAHHAMIMEELAESGEEADGSWRDGASDALQEAWVMAALPERHYGSLEHLLRDVYRILYARPYDFERIAAIIAHDEDTRAGRGIDEHRAGRRALLFHLH